MNVFCTDCSTCTYECLSLSSKYLIYVKFRSIANGHKPVDVAHVIACSLPQISEKYFEQMLALSPTFIKSYPLRVCLLRISKRHRGRVFALCSFFFRGVIV